MTLPALKLPDERFFEHRRRSTSIAGVTVGVLANLLFLYRYFFQNIANWDLLAMALAFVVVKVAMMIWYHLKD